MKIKLHFEFWVGKYDSLFGNDWCWRGLAWLFYVQTHPQDCIADLGVRLFGRRFYFNFHCP